MLKLLAYDGTLSPTSNATFSTTSNTNPPTRYVSYNPPQKSHAPKHKRRRFPPYPDPPSALHAVAQQPL